MVAKSVLWDRIHVCILQKVLPTWHLLPLIPKQTFKIWVGPHLREMSLPWGGKGEGTALLSQVVHRDFWDDSSERFTLSLITEQQEVSNHLVVKLRDQEYPGYIVIPSLKNVSNWGKKKAPYSTTHSSFWSVLHINIKGTVSFPLHVIWTSIINLEQRMRCASLKQLHFFIQIYCSIN